MYYTHPTFCAIPPMHQNQTPLQPLQQLLRRLLPPQLMMMRQQMSPANPILQIPLLSPDSVNTTFAFKSTLVSLIVQGFAVVSCNLHSIGGAGSTSFSPHPVYVARSTEQLTTLAASGTAIGAIGGGGSRRHFVVAARSDPQSPPLLSSLAFLPLPRHCRRRCE